MKINLQQKKFIDEDVLKKIIKIGINFGERLNTIDSKCIDDFSEDKLYLKGEACYKDGYIYRAVVSTEGAWVDARWEKVGTDDFTELSIDDIKAMIGLTQDQIDYLAKLISDDTIVLDHTWSSSKSYTEIQEAIKTAKEFCVTELAKKSTGSFKIASSTAEVTDGNYLYLIMNAVSSKYDIYALIDSNVEKLTTVDVNLDNYLTKTEIETDYLKKTDADGKYATVTTLTNHTSDTDIHVTVADKTKWDKVTDKVDKTDITDTIDSTSTNDKAAGAKAVHDIVPFKFGIDDNGNYGYYKAGADTVTPFKSSVEPEDTGKIYGKNGRIKLMKIGNLRYFEPNKNDFIEVGMDDIVLDEEDRPLSNTTIIGIFTDNGRDWTTGRTVIGTNGKFTLAYPGYYFSFTGCRWIAKS